MHTSRMFLFQDCIDLVLFETLQSKHKFPRNHKHLMPENGCFSCRGWMCMQQCGIHRLHLSVFFRFTFPCRLYSFPPTSSLCGLYQHSEWAGAATTICCAWSFFCPSCVCVCVLRLRISIMGCWCVYSAIHTTFLRVHQLLGSLPKDWCVANDLSLKGNSNAGSTERSTRALHAGDTIIVVRLKCTALLFLVLQEGFFVCTKNNSILL